MAFPHDGKKFEEGNPGGPGRPKGSLSFKNRVQLALEKEVEIKKKRSDGTIDPEVVKISAMDAMIDAQVKKAINHSDTKAFEALRKAGYSEEEVQPLHVSGPDGAPIQTATLSKDEYQKMLKEAVKAAQEEV